MAQLNHEEIQAHYKEIPRHAVQEMEAVLQAWFNAYQPKAERTFRYSPEDGTSPRVRVIVQLGHALDWLKYGN